MFRTIAAAALLTLTVSALPAAAADEAAAATAAPIVTAAGRISQSLSRPVVLPALYASYAALQVYDIYSTRQALARGGREANPLMQGVVGNSGTLLAVKAGATIGAVVAAERLWRKGNKTAAIAVLVVSNGVAAAVAARNASTLRKLR